MKIGNTEWQEAIYPYVKSEAAYKDPNDSRKTTGFEGGGSSGDPLTEMIQNPQTYAATSFLMNSNVMDKGNGTPVSVSEAAMTSPSDFILLMEGTTDGDWADDFAASSKWDPGYSKPDHNGNVISPWRLTYTNSYYEVGNGQTGTDHGLNAIQLVGCNADPLLAAAPMHKRGVIFCFFDGHTKFVPVDPADYVKAAQTLEAKYPVWKCGIIPQASAPVGNQWFANNPFNICPG